jgi:hypothetical protein
LGPGVPDFLSGLGRLTRLRDLCIDAGGRRQVPFYNGHRFELSDEDVAGVGHSLSLLTRLESLCIRLEEGELIESETSVKEELRHVASTLPKFSREHFKVW